MKSITTAATMYGLVDDLIAPLRQIANRRAERHGDHADRVDDRKCGRKCGSGEANVHNATTGYRFHEGKRQVLDALGGNVATSAMQRAVNIDDLRRLAEAPASARSLRLHRRRRRRRGHAARELPDLRSRALSPTQCGGDGRVRPAHDGAWNGARASLSCSRRSAAAACSFREANASRRRKPGQLGRHTFSRRSRAAGSKRFVPQRAGPVWYQLYLIGGREVAAAGDRTRASRRFSVRSS